MVGLSDRIDKILEYSCLSIPKFAAHIGVKTPQSIREILKGNTKTLSYEMKIKILSAYPEINESWLMDGVGDMINSKIVQNNQNGDNINGHAVNVNKVETDSFMELLKKKDEQIDRLLSIIESMNKQ